MSINAFKYLCYLSVFLKFIFQNDFKEINYIPLRENEKGQASKPILSAGYLYPGVLCIR